jgi:phage gpG-like protein
MAVKGLDDLPDRVRSAAKIGLARGLLYAVGVVQRKYLSGPRPAKLNVVTTRLRNSISSEVTDDGDNIKGVIGTNVVYAAYHEFGFSGVEHVKGFTRMVTPLHGLGVEVGKNGKLKRSRRPRPKVAQAVKAHDRKVNYKGRPFLRPGVKEALPAIIGEIRAELALVKGQS